MSVKADTFQSKVYRNNYFTKFGSLTERNDIKVSKNLRTSCNSTFLAKSVCSRSTNGSTFGVFSLLTEAEFSLSIAVFLTEAEFSIINSNRSLISHSVEALRFFLSIDGQWLARHGNLEHC